MSSGRSDLSNPNEQGLGSPEIEFALVLSRVIESVKNDPEDLRQAIYELARYKLQEQISDVDAADADRSKAALEAAIRGVEDFSQRDALSQIPAFLTKPQTSPARLEIAAPGEPRFGKGKAPINASYVLGDARRYLRTFMMIATAVVLVVAGLFYSNFSRLASKSPTQVPRQEVAAAPPAPVVVPAAPKPSRLLPTEYGVYAIDDAGLVPLQQIPGRPSDMRVAISAAITAPPQSVLVTARPKFIVFRRDIGVNASDKADVRIVAKVARSFSTTAGDTEKNWVMRNIAFPFRASPIADNPDMFELHSEDPALELTPGRYALALKTTAFDFTVAGTPVDARQCLERVVSTSGTFYAECKKP